MAAAVKEWEVNAVAVRHTPFAAMLSPIWRPSSTLLQEISKTAQAASFCNFFKLPTSSMIPVNMV